MNVLENHLNKNNVVSVSTEVKQDNIQVEQKVETKKDGKKLLFAGAVAAAAIGGAVVLMSKGKAKPSDVQKAGKKAVQEIANNIPKKANNVADDVVEVVTDKVDDVVDVVLPKIKDIKFDKGVAFKDGKKYTGIIEDTLKSGKKVVLEYKDGVIQKSTIDSVEKVIDHKAVKELSQKAKAQHDKLNKILSNKDNLSLEEFTSQVDEIKFKSKNDLAKIDEIKSSKLKALEKAAKKVAKRTSETNIEILKKNLDEAESNLDYYYISRPKDSQKAIDSIDSVINYYKAAIEHSKALGDDYKYVEAGLEDAIKYKEYLIAFQEKFKYYTSHFQDDEIKNLYQQAIQGKQNIDDLEFDVLKNVYAKKFELDSFDFIKSIGPDEVDIHHSLHGMGASLRKDLVRTNGKSDWAHEIDLKFENLKPTESDCIVYRGTSKTNTSISPVLEIIEKANIGDRIVTNPYGYSYTAFHRSLAESFAQNGLPKEKRGILSEIRIPKGAKVSRNLEHGGEIIMPRGAEYKLISKGTDPHGFFNVVLEYILPKN